METNNLKTIQANFKAETYFKKPFLNSFFINIKRLGLNEEQLFTTDSVLASYEKTEIDFHLEKDLRFHNDFLASFAISKAENSALTVVEAEELYREINNKDDNKVLKLLKSKIAEKKALTKKDHDRLEYYNIAKTLAESQNSDFKLFDLNINFITDLHKRLTIGLDIFDGKLEGFECYHSGKLRADDETRVADYQPAPYLEIKENLEELIAWFKANPSAINLFIFHAALYSIHPFKNGNKRVCRVLESLILRAIGYNQKNLYSTSYYYHKHKDRYYKYLVESIYKHNLTYFVGFAAEALYFSALGVIVGVLQRKKSEFLQNSGLEDETIKLLKSLVKKGEVRFERFYALAKRKVSKQTFINHLSEALDRGVILKRAQGRNTYYSLAGNYPETELLKQGLKGAREKLNYLPEELISYL
jgi:Fic family protein